MYTTYYYAVWRAQDEKDSHFICVCVVDSRFLSDSCARCSLVVLVVVLLLSSILVPYSPPPSSSSPSRLGVGGLDWTGQVGKHEEGSTLLLSFPPTGRQASIHPSAGARKTRSVLPPAPFTRPHRRVWWWWRRPLRAHLIETVSEKRRKKRGVVKLRYYIVYY